MTLDIPADIYDKATQNKSHDSVKFLCGKVALICILGSFSLSAYNPAVNLVAVIGIMAVFTSTLNKGDYFSFVTQLFFCNHFVFGNDKGGLFNIVALFTLLIFALSGKKFARFPSSFGPGIRFLLIVLFLFQIIGLTANMNATIGAKISGFASFTGMIILIYQLSTVKLTKQDLVRFIYVLFFFSIYELIVSLNQKYHFIHINSPLFPLQADATDFQYDIFRCMGTFINFEAYAEYSLSIIALLLPGIISGSFKKISMQFYAVTVGLVIISLISIVLSVTRSSFFLLPFVVVFILYSQRKNIKFTALVPFAFLIVGMLLLNTQLKIVDISAFTERSKEMNITNLSDITSGNEINRGDIFAYAFKKIERSKGILGEGYFTTPFDYYAVHFGKRKPDVGDYHNLYLSIVVFWGVPGALAFLMIFFSSIYKGITAVKHAKQISDFDRDILVGFNALFVFFLINQYKIIFLRESNYTLVIFILLLIYLALIKKVKTPLVKVDYQIVKSVNSKNSFHS
jgi:O-antigen ligase